MDTVEADYGSTANAEEYLALSHQPRYQGSVVVVHARGVLILPHHVMALNKYLDHVKETGEMASKVGFMAFWKTYEEDMASTGQNINGIPSPYYAETRGGESLVDPDTDRIRDMLFDYMHRLHQVRILSEPWRHWAKEAFTSCFGNRTRTTFRTAFDERHRVVGPQHYVARSFLT